MVEPVNQKIEELKTQVKEALKRFDYGVLRSLKEKLELMEWAKHVDSTYKV